MLKSKSAVVTGSTSGIGLAIAHGLAAQGCNVLFNGFGEAAAIDALVVQTATQYGVKTGYSNADMTKPDQIRGLIAQCDKEFGGTDILVNNAGIQFTAPIAEYPEEKWDAIIAINLSSAFHSTKAALPGMQARKFGRIVNIASVHGLVGSKNKSAYVAAKHGLVGFTKVTALEMAESGITCNAICPGWVMTPLVQKQIDDRAREKGCSPEEATKELLSEKEPTHRFTQAEDIAAMAVFLCGENAGNITGSCYTLDGGWTTQ